MTLTKPYSSSGPPLGRGDGQLQDNSKPVVISVDGACRGNGTGHAKAGVGVYVGPGSGFNESTPLNLDRPTNQKAELLAGIHGLNKALEMDGGPSRHVVIKSDSQYMVKGVNEWSQKWESNGYLNANGQPVANAYLFQELKESVRELNESGIEVDFQHVPREQNQDADRLANQSFSDSYSAPSSPYYEQPGSYGSEDPYEASDQFHEPSDCNSESLDYCYDSSDHHHESTDYFYDSPAPYTEPDDYHHDDCNYDDSCYDDCNYDDSCYDDCDYDD
ncbi:uncharacterized protein GIQ15_00729 [Arthroderma uncinatum]|uniref:uncharacterized protein n=1 Tax=Arthroderma uncinatum TaxID=74035 RepID=UPI00144AA06E|nr:uncharacterized protein GIQ15_00729 [Arthroderma uncinatum]KAF3491212.1 hypothetical protein GIQ15_00729 [Arthroderma uncinatum]